jgi:hypothetical protein
MTPGRRFGVGGQETGSRSDFLSTPLRSVAPTELYALNHQLSTAQVLVNVKCLDLTPLSPSSEEMYHTLDQLIRFQAFRLATRRLRKSGA